MSASGLTPAALPGTAQNPCLHFHHGHTRSQRGVDRAQFQTDVTTADNQQPAGDLIQFQGRTRIHDPGVIHRQCGRTNWDRPRRHDQSIKLEASALSLRAGQIQRMWIEEFPPGGDHVDLPRGRQLADSRTKAGDNFIFPGTQSIEIDPRSSKFDAAVGQRRGLTNATSDMQQCLGGYAAVSQARPPRDGPIINEGHVKSGVGGCEGGRIAAGSGAKHDQWCALDAPGHRFSLGQRFGPDDGLITAL